MRDRSKRWSLVGVILALVLSACSGSQSGDTQGATAADPGASQSSAPPVTSPPVDPMAVARLDGLYDVVKKVVAAKNFSDIKVGDSFTRTYDVMPDCATGPCGGTVEIDAEESKQNITQTLIWDGAKHTYSLRSPISPAVCTGVDGKKYDLKTTSTFTLTPTKVDPAGPEFVVSKFTAVGVLKAVPAGNALHKGHCNVSTAKYLYTGHQG